MKMYAGIGTRKTPSHIIDIMYKTAIILSINGFVCNTGAAKGAEQIFAKGAVSGNGLVNLMLPWPSYEKKWIDNLIKLHPEKVLKWLLAKSNKEAFESVRLHPSYTTLSQAVIKLHARNFMILKKAQFVVCYTPGGKEIGGTGQAIRIAKSLDIIIYNLGDQYTLTNFEKSLEKRKDILKNYKM